MTSLSLVQEAHKRIRSILLPGDIVIDATVGNGYDTLFLADCIQPGGRVFGFDIQEAALISTRNKLAQGELAEYVELIQASHSDMIANIKPAYRGQIKAIMFNLGYLPGSDKTITTQAQSTLVALNQALDLLALNGIISVMAYPGHPGGNTETQQVTEWFEQLRSLSCDVISLNSLKASPTTPRLFMAQAKVTD